MIPEYSVEPKSRKDLRQLADALREMFHLEDKVYFPIVQLLDVLPEYIPDFTYEIVDDDEFDKNVHADTDIVHNHIRIKESVYIGADDGNGRDRMTIAHEVCHLVTLGVLGFRLQRNFSKELKPYEDPEWQAKCMAGELMVNKKLVEDLSAFDIEERCGVSFEAARKQYNAFKKEAKM